MTYDHIVIGVGGMGSATVRDLARRGLKVLGLEQFDIPHDQGSSHGLTRIFRFAYNSHPNYVPLMQRAYAMWLDLEEEAGEKLQFVTGGVDVSDRNGKVFQGALASCNKHGLAHEVLDAADLCRRFPGMAMPEGFAAVYQPDAGYLLSERCIVANVMSALKAGADIRAREKVLSWENEGSGVTVTTTRGTYKAGSLIVTAGAWAGKMLAPLLPNAVPERQVLGWFLPHDASLYQPANFPVFVLDAEEGHYYGFPLHGVPGFKIGRFRHFNEDTDPDNVRRTIDDQDEAILRLAVSRYFPQANGPTMALKTCMFTNTPDEHFILDKLPGHPQVTIAAGFSGHGFKFCTVVGEIMADLATKGTTRHDIDMFALNRFAAKAA